MKKFLAVFTGSPTSAARRQWDRLEESERRRRESEGMQAWRKWGELHQQDVIYPGAPLGKTKQAAADGISDTRNNLAAFVIVQADSHEAAARMFENHPHFRIFPGDAVEVMECLPIPGGQ
jgi:hypothetical protein